GELLHRADAHLRLAGVVLPDGLHLDVLLLQILDGELDAVAQVFADGRLGTGHRVDDADLHRSGSGGGGDEDRGSEQDSSDRHALTPSLVGERIKHTQRDFSTTPTALDAATAAKVRNADRPPGTPGGPRVSRSPPAASRCTRTSP